MTDGSVRSYPSWRSGIRSHRTKRKLLVLCCGVKRKNTICFGLVPTKGKRGKARSRKSCRKIASPETQFPIVVAAGVQETISHDASRLVRRLNAFIWDSSRLEFEAARDCRLITAGELFGRSGYAVGLRKGSPWTDRVTLAVLDFHERPFIFSLSFLVTFAFRSSSTLSSLASDTHDKPNSQSSLS